jgi:hypothetical protein
VFETTVGAFIVKSSSAAEFQLPGLFKKLSMSKLLSKERDLIKGEFVTPSCLRKLGGPQQHVAASGLCCRPRVQRMGHGFTGWHCGQHDGTRTGKGNFIVVQQT